MHAKMQRLGCRVDKVGGRGDGRGWAENMKYDFAVYTSNTATGLSNEKYSPISNITLVVKSQNSDQYHTCIAS